MRRALALVFLVGCATRDGGVAQNAIDVNVAPIGLTPGTEIKTSGEPSVEGRCSLSLVASSIEKSSSGCYLDAHITKVVGTLSYPCGGNGAAEADFGDEHYAGKIEDGRLTIDRATELDWEDSCRWATRAVLEGTLPRGKPLSRQNVAWTYSDRVVSGDNCSGICRAHANVVASVDLPRAATEAAED